MSQPKIMIFGLKYQNIMENLSLLKIILDIIIFIKIIIHQIYLTILKIFLMFANITHNFINKISTLNI